MTIKSSPCKAQLLPYLEQYGQSCLAYSSLQPDLEYYLEEDVGFIAYLSFKHLLLAPKGRKIVLADPVCAPDQKRGLLERFILKYQRVMVLQCSAQMAETLSEMGYEVNHIGHEASFPIPLKLAGKHRAQLRQWNNKCQREGVVVEEKRLSECDLEEAKKLSADWMKQKGGKAFIFLTRPFVWEDEPEVRYFWARREGKLIGFAAFDPIWHKGEVVGYYHNFDRILKQAPNGTSAFIILEAAKVFAQENCRSISLGLMPLYALRPHFPHNEFTMKALRYAHHNLNSLYPFRGNISHKKKFSGSRQPVYFSSTQGNRLWEMFILMRAMKMI